MKIQDKLISGSNGNIAKVATTSERLQKILLERNMRQADLARATGISKGAISNYVLGRYTPKEDIIQKLANALNCSERWLLGYDVPMKKSLNPFDDSENPYELEIRDVFDELDFDSQLYVVGWIKAFAKNTTKMKSSPSELQLTEGEKMMIDIFRLIPEDQQKVFLEMGRVYANSLKKD